MFVRIAFENLGLPSVSTRQLLSNPGRDWQTLRQIAVKPVLSFRDAQYWYSTLTTFCCMTVCQIVTAWIVRHTHFFSLHIFVLFKPTNNNSRIK